MGGSEVRSRSGLHAASVLILLVACAGKSNGDRFENDGASGSPQGGSGGIAGTAGMTGNAGTAGAGLGGERSDSVGTGGIAGGGAAGAGSGGASLAGGGATAGGGIGGFSQPPCQPYPVLHNDPACPGGQVPSGTYYVSACTEGLTCDFLVPTGDPCFQPPIALPFQCCGWGFAGNECPTLPAGQDPRCVMPVGPVVPCTDEGLTCQVDGYNSGSTTDFVCCDGIFQFGASCGPANP